MSIPASIRFLIACLALSLVLAPGCGSRDPEQTPPATAPDRTTEEQVVEEVFVVLETTAGSILIELYPALAPISVENFLAYVEDGFYNETIFHRTIPNFMIQGGGFTVEMVEKETRSGIENEWENGLANERSSIAMARLSGRPNSATAQFFINVRDNLGLDQPADGAGYAVFGRVVAGMAVVDAIATTPTTTRAGHQNVPAEPVVITTARRATEGEIESMLRAELQ